MGKRIGCELRVVWSDREPTMVKVYPSVRQGLAGMRGAMESGAVHAAVWVGHRVVSHREDARVRLWCGVTQATQAFFRARGGR